METCSVSTFRHPCLGEERGVTARVGRTQMKRDENEQRRNYWAENSNLLKVPPEVAAQNWDVCAIMVSAPIDAIKVLIDDSVLVF